MKKKKTTSNKIKRDMTFQEFIEKNEKAADLLMEMGLGCAICPMASHETLEEGIKSHGLDIEKVLKKIKRKLKDEKK